MTEQQPAPKSPPQPVAAAAPIPVQKPVPVHPAAPSTGQKQSWADEAVPQQQKRRRNRGKRNGPETITYELQQPQMQKQQPLEVTLRVYGDGSVTRTINGGAERVLAGPVGGPGMPSRTGVDISSALADLQIAVQEVQDALEAGQKLRR